MTNLGQALRAFEQKFEVENRLLAGDIGIHASTLTRIKQGKMPDAVGLAKIISWLVRPALTKGESR